MKIILATIIVAILAILTGDSDNKGDFKKSLLKLFLKEVLTVIFYIFLKMLGLDIDINIISFVLSLLLK